MSKTQSLRTVDRKKMTKCQTDMENHRQKYRWTHPQMEVEETADTTDVLGAVLMAEHMFLYKDDKEKRTRGQKCQDREKVPSHLGTDNSTGQRARADL